MTAAQTAHVHARMGDYPAVAAHRIRNGGDLVLVVARDEDGEVIRAEVLAEHGAPLFDSQHL